MSVDNVKKSFGRCLLKSGFLDRFYEVFLASSPEIGNKFQDTDFDKQKELLKSSINYLIMFKGGSEFAKSEIDKVAVIHDQDHQNIPPHLYHYWTDSLLKTVEEFDPDFGPNLKKDWLDVTSAGLEIFKENYIVKQS